MTEEHREGMRSHDVQSSLPLSIMVTNGHLRAALKDAITVPNALLAAAAACAVVAGMRRRRLPRTSTSPSSSLGAVAYHYTPVKPALRTLWRRISGFLQFKQVRRAAYIRRIAFSCRKGWNTEAWSLFRRPSQFRTILPRFKFNRTQVCSSLSHTL
jgi:hypothetical protein